MEKANDLGIQLPRHVIFGEPTELKLAVSQKVSILIPPPPQSLLTESLHHSTVTGSNVQGIIMFKLEFEGKASHSYASSVDSG
jgi:hypothetical protein